MAIVTKNVISQVLLTLNIISFVFYSRKEQEIEFRPWLYTMRVFVPWKLISWIFGFIVNDMIFAYNIIMLISWFFLNIMNYHSLVCVWSLYLELNDLTKIQDLARLKMETMSSMAPSRVGSTIHGGSRYYFKF